MKNKLTKYVIRILAGILGILTIAVTLFLFLYIFWKGKNVMSLSFILDKPAGVPLVEGCHVLLVLVLILLVAGYRLEQQVESIRH